MTFKEMQMVEFVIDGECVAKARPRMANGHAYTPKTTKVYEGKVRDSLIAVTRAKTFPLYGKDVALQCNIQVVKKVPKSYSEKKRKQCLSGEIRPTGKSDLDNYVKSVLDGMNGYAYEDDSAVCRIKAEKVYGEEAYTLVQLFRIGEKNERKSKEK